MFLQEYTGTDNDVKPFIIELSSVRTRFISVTILQYANQRRLAIDVYGYPCGK